MPLDPPMHDTTPGTPTPAPTPARPQRLVAPPAGPHWPALAAARRADHAVRWPFVVRHAGQDWSVGSVALAQREALAAWPDAFDLSADGVVLKVESSRRTACLAEVNASLRRQGLIHAWRDEPYRLPGFRPGTPAAPWQSLAVIERASARFWGSLTFGAHCNGYVADACGRPTHLWVATRSATKPTDPGLLDNLIGGGVPLSQTPREALLREAWEEAGLAPEDMAALQPGGVLSLHCDVPEGLQREWLYVFDLPLPPGRVPQNQDGEVAEHRLWPIDEALALAASGAMTVDAALATLDFALRHRLVASDWEDALAPLRVDPAAAAQFDDATDVPSSA